MPRSTSTASTPAKIENSLPQLVGNALADVRDLLRAELRLAKVEIRDDVTAMARRGAQAAVAIALALAGLSSLLMALGFALALVLPTWSAHLIIGVTALGAAGGWLAWLGYRATRREALVPERTLAALEEDRRWMRQKLS
jgi:uncharacterized membrane protein YqjE